MDRKTGKTLAKKWTPNTKHALYRETGNWYHQLEKFPGVLFDKDGFKVFESKSDFENCPELKKTEATNTVTVSGGIKTIPGYTRYEALGLLSNRSRQEGHPVTVTLTRYERDPAARSECLEHFGSRSRCQVCKADLQERYGNAAAYVIHVHHLDPLGRAKMKHAVDPKTDLLPVCPNCHSVIHARRPIPYTPDEIRELLNPSR